MTHLSQGPIHELWRFSDCVRVVMFLACSAINGQGAVVIVVVAAAATGGTLAARVHIFAPRNSSSVVAFVGRFLLLSDRFLGPAAILAGRQIHHLCVKLI